MKHYEKNSPEAVARILAMFVISDGVIDEREMEKFDTLNVFELLGISRKNFIAVLKTYCDQISDEAENDGTIHLIAEERTQEMLDAVTDRKKQLLTCALALDLCKADETISDPEMVLLRYMMNTWHISLESLEAEFVRA